MSLYVLDTDVLVLFQDGHPTVRRNVLTSPPIEIATTVITVEEQLSGWYSLLRRAKGKSRLAHAYQRLADTAKALADFSILSFTETAIDRFEQMKALKLGVRHMDLRIAAITLEHGGTLVTRNVRDFANVPGLAIADWTV